MDVLATCMTEVTAIVHNRPLVSVSSDPEAPLVLSPSMILTQKCDYIVEAKNMLRASGNEFKCYPTCFDEDGNKNTLYLLQPRRKFVERW